MFIVKIYFYVKNIDNLNVMEKYLTFIFVFFKELDYFLYDDFSLLNSV